MPLHTLDARPKHARKRSFSDGLWTGPARTRTRSSSAQKKLKAASMRYWPARCSVFFDTAVIRPSIPPARRTDAYSERRRAISLTFPSE